MKRIRTPRGGARRAGRYLLIGGALAAGAIAAAPASAAQVLPDLVPVNPSAGAGSWYIDVTSAPGKVRLRFPGGVSNLGTGAFDIQGTGAVTPAGVQQIIQDSAGPSTMSPLSGLTMSGTPGLTGFTNWVSSNLVTFTLTPKVGQVPTVLTAAPKNLCLSDRSAAFACKRATGAIPEMGLGPGKTDDGTTDGVHFNTFFDVTGKAGLFYTFTAKVNPAPTGGIMESNTTNDIASLPTDSIEIPQVTITSASDSLSATAGQPAALALSAHPTAQQIAGGAPAANGGQVATDANSTFQVVTPPAHGTVTISGSTATYTASTSYSGADSFTYQATDARGLVSAGTRTVSVSVKAAPVSPPAPTTRPATTTNPVSTGTPNAPRPRVIVLSVAKLRALPAIFPSAAPRGCSKAQLRAKGSRCARAQARIGTTLSFSASGAMKLRVSVKRVGAKRATGFFLVRAKAGKNSIRFTGSLTRGHPLARGRYAISLASAAAPAKTLASIGVKIVPAG